MRHIKSFTDSYNKSSDDNFKNELKDFSETHLAYLLDKGDMNIEVVKHHSFECEEWRYDNKCTCPFRIDLDFEKTNYWKDIKDDIIPFITHLSKSYKIIEKVQVYKDIHTFHFLQDVIDNKASIKSIDHIYLTIEK